LKKLAHKKDGTMAWITDRDMEKIRAFYGSLEDFEKIPDWDQDMPSLELDQDHSRLDHGYEESKKKLEIEDLQKAAGFRGGQLKSATWDGNMFKPLQWKCCQRHSFQMTPHAVLKGGHWCLDCISPPWNYTILAEKNPFASQVLAPLAK
jgi:hypothetical protein